MRESQNLGTLLVEKTLMVPYFVIGKNVRHVLKAFDKAGKRLSLAHHVIFGVQFEVPWKDELGFNVIQ